MNVLTEITYLRGDVTYPRGDGMKLIAHVCNDIGAWGAGVVMAISKRWSAPEQHYRSLFIGDKTIIPGLCFSIAVELDIRVVNMIAMDGLRSRKNPCPLNYKALRSCLTKLAVHAKNLIATVHMPRIGCGLAGGEWSKVEKIINETLVKLQVPTFVYDL